MPKTKASRKMQPSMTGKHVRGTKSRRAKISSLRMKQGQSKIDLEVARGDKRYGADNMGRATNTNKVGSKVLSSSNKMPK